MPKTLQTIDRFFAGAKDLRSEFDNRFADPRAAGSGRFVWDYWHVPDQYTTLRTPAYLFFQKELYERFHNQLVWWGRRNLGCHDVSPPWMSCYVDGCKQELHGDLPHGPWAFVFSLTPWKSRRFQGGETFLLREEILSFWSNFDSNKGLERGDALVEVPPLFNRLTVFDPRIPHGVREVKGVQAVTEGRLVIHGWFVKPRPFVEGPLSTRDLQSAIDGLSHELEKLFHEGLEIQGMLSMHFSVAASGEIHKIRPLASTLRHPGGDERIEPALVRHIAKVLRGVRFKKQKGPSQVTLPLLFESGS